MDGPIPPEGILSRLKLPLASTVKSLVVPGKGKRGKIWLLVALSFGLRKALKKLTSFPSSYLFQRSAVCVSSAPGAVERVMRSVLGVTELLYPPHKPKSKLEEQRPESDEAWLGAHTPDRTSLKL